MSNSKSRNKEREREYVRSRTWIFVSSFRSVFAGIKATRSRLKRPSNIDFLTGCEDDGFGRGLKGGEAAADYVNVNICKLTSGVFRATL